MTVVSYLIALIYVVTVLGIIVGFVSALAHFATQRGVIGGIARCITVLFPLTIVVMLLDLFLRGWDSPIATGLINLMGG